MRKLLICVGVSLLSIGLFVSCEEDVQDTQDSYVCSCSTELSSSVQCSGTTQVGASCQNNTLNCCGYCYLHTSQYTP